VAGLTLQENKTCGCDLDGTVSMVMECAVPNLIKIGSPEKGRTSKKIGTLAVSESHFVAMVNILAVFCVKNELRL